MMSCVLSIVVNLSEYCRAGNAAVSHVFQFHADKYLNLFKIGRGTEARLYEVSPDIFTKYHASQMSFYRRV